MNINIDKIKEEIYETKKLIANNLSKEEEEEINIFIDSLFEDLQNKIKKINIAELTKKINSYFKENKDV
jgi:hypothetical protein